MIHTRVVSRQSKEQNVSPPPRSLCTLSLFLFLRHGGVLVTNFYVIHTRGPFLEGPERFSHPESRSKISNHTITELFIHIFLRWTEVIFKQEVSGVYTSRFLDTDYLEMASRARKAEMLKSDWEMLPRVRGREGVLPEKLGGCVRPASQNPYPIYEQSLRFSLFMTWAKIRNLIFDLASVSRKPGKLFEPAKPFLVSRYLKTARCIRLKFLLWREPLFMLRICV